ncbi:MAG: efflux RND transporter periplasmic adaptor subunit [Candidatus Sericytochromatia bacterium]|nr:efflux RND transporter periplasmic adaptor subunit [Candidatus Sericytochromatia bacterium]
MLPTKADAVRHDALITWLTSNHQRRTEQACAIAGLAPTQHFALTTSRDLDAHTGSDRMNRILGASLILLVALLGCKGRSGDNGEAKAKQGPMVIVAAASHRPMTLDVPGVGHVEPVESVDVRPQASGTLSRVLFKEGDTVHEGQVLFEIDRAPLVASLRRAEAVLSRDKAEHAMAKSQFERYDDLYRQEAVSREQVEQFRTSASSLEAAMQADQAAIDQARVQLHFATLTAPISGRTGSLTVTIGNVVRPTDTSPLVMIHKINPIRVSFAVPEQHLTRIRAGQQAGILTVVATPQGSKTPTGGQLDFVSNAVDAATGTIMVKAIFTNDSQHLWPGQYVTTLLTLERQPNALVVPSQAIQNGRKGPFVFVIGSDSAAEARPVTVDRIQAGYAVIGRGLKPGEQVVTDGQLQVIPGKPVTIAPRRPETAKPNQMMTGPPNQTPSVTPSQASMGSASQSTTVTPNNPSTTGRPGTPR